MSEGDPRDTQRYPPTPTTELRGVGFFDAEEIGHGGFGVVYRCTEPDLDRTVAVKVITADLSDENRMRFFREQRAMGRLTGHPNIIGILRVGVTEGGLPYIVMPYHPQDSLDVRIRNGGPLSLRNALRLGVKMAGAVETAHRLGILHRDIKPGNILLTDYGEPELSDFGIAHIAGGFETVGGAVTGSPAYTAPEVLEGGPPSPSADIYGLSSTVFSALTGHAAFERRSGEQVVAQFLRITTQPVPDLREHGIPADVSAVIARGMARAPEQRLATAAEFGDELRQLQLRHNLPVDEMALSASPGTELDADRRARERELGSRPIAPFTPEKTGSFPRELTSFVGRRHEIIAVRNLLSGSRLVTLTGIGGVGKTRLAMRIATTTNHDFADGSRLVELSELHDRPSMVEAVAAAVGARDQSDQPLREVLIEHLAGQTMLLVLDNCEQAVAEVAEITGYLLQACPELRILATSREPLGIAGESVLRVPPLTVPEPTQRPSLRRLPKYDAVALFAERASAVVPEFAITADNAATVAGICRRLDGLPLSIELAAARLRAMSAEQILKRLTNRYTLLTRGNRDLPTRQQTLQLCIDWSFELCTAREQLVWGRVSIFAGSFELDAAEQVCGIELTPDELLDVLDSLTDKSILIRDQQGLIVRFRILETLRDYGQQKLKITGEDVTLRRRHRDWYMELAHDAEVDWISAGQLDWIRRLKREQYNLREALAFSIDDNPSAGLRTATALFPFWSSQGLYSEGLRWTSMLLDHQNGPPTVDRIKAIYCASVMANVQGDLQTATGYVEEGYRLTTRTHDPMMHAYVAFADGMLALYEGDPVRASAQLESATAEFSTRGDRTLEVASLYPLGLAYELSGDAVSAIDLHERVLAITKKHGEKKYRSHSLWALGIAVWQQGDASRAIQLLEQSLELTRQVRSPRIAASAIEALAWITCELASPQRAAVMLGAADGVARSIGSGAVIFSNLASYHQNCEDAVRQEIGKRAYDTAHLKGQRLGFDKAIAYALNEELPSTPASNATSTSLTKRERQVADLIAEGLTNQSIADRLVISLRTAQGHVEHILTKLDFTSRTQVAAWVVDQTNSDPSTDRP